jgi:hypothetical protein
VSWISARMKPFNDRYHFQTLYLSVSSLPKLCISALG